MEVTQVPINRWLHKEVVGHIYNGLLLSHKKEWNITICNNIDGSRGYYAKWNKSDKDKHHMMSHVKSKEQHKQTKQK